MRTGYDVSNWTGGPTAAWDAIANSGASLLMPQAIDPPSGYPRGVTRDQVQWGLDRGFQVVPYLWKWFGVTLDDIRRKLDLLEPFTGQIDALDLDVEDTFVGALQGLAVKAEPIPAEHLERIKRQPPPEQRVGLPVGAALSLEQRIDELLAAYELLDAFPTRLGIPALHYTGRWYHVPYLANTDRFAAARGLHVAAYDGIFDPDQFARFGGWSTAAIKQPGGTMSVGGVGNVDPDVVADDALVATAPTPTPEPAQEDPAWVAKKPRVVEIAGELLAVADQLDAAADQPATVHELATGVRDRAGEILA
jgi:hypothetical protein